MAEKVYMRTLKVFFVFLACASFRVHAGPVEQRYDYDPLGRLVKVTEGGAEKAGYCYDDAGNRIKVNASGGDCEVVKPTPVAPTWVSRGSHQGGGCYVNWAHPGGAAKFELQMRGSNIVTLDGSKRSYEHNTRCFDWIRACSANNACSEKVNFP